MQPSEIAVRIALWLVNCNAGCAELSNHCLEICHPEIDHPGLFWLPEVLCVLLEWGERGWPRVLMPRLLLVACWHKRDTKIGLVPLRKALRVLGPEKQAANA